MIVDALGSELAVGDIVVFSTMDAAGLVIGLVTKMTPKGVRVAYVQSWSSSHPQLRDMSKTGTNVCKVDKGLPKAIEFLKVLVPLQIAKDLA